MLDFKKQAFSFAESLIVLTVIAVVSVTAVSFVAKKHLVKTDVKKFHGRYECGYSSGGNLRQKTIIDGTVKGTESWENVSKCSFQLKMATDFISIQAVGGGGGGSKDAAGPTTLKDGTTLNPIGGGSGEIKTLNYPPLSEGEARQMTFELTPGKGGGIGKNGAQTSIKLKSSKSNSFEMIAGGGIAGNGYMQKKYDGDNTSDTTGLDDTAAATERGYGAGGAPGKTGQSGATIIVW